jgi:hypothetical protein
MRSIGRILVDLETDHRKRPHDGAAQAFRLRGRHGSGHESTRRNVKAIPHAFAEKHRVVPLRYEGEHTLVVAMEDPSDLLIIDAIKNQVGMNVRALVASCDDVQGGADIVSGRRANPPQATPAVAATSSTRQGLSPPAGVLPLCADLRASAAAVHDDPAGLVRQPRWLTHQKDMAT